MSEPPIGTRFGLNSPRRPTVTPVHVTMVRIVRGGDAVGGAVAAIGGVIGMTCPATAQNPLPRAVIANADQGPMKNLSRLGGATTRRNIVNEATARIRPTTIAMM